jgi:predicted transcriptional regulator
MKYRSRNEIVGLLLHAVNGEAGTKTKLLYKAYLSFNQLREYLALLIENGLIEYEEGMATYRTTEKGMRVLHLHNEMDEVAPISCINSKNVVKRKGMLTAMSISAHQKRRKGQSSYISPETELQFEIECQGGYDTMEL